MTGADKMEFTDEELLISARTVVRSCLEVREHENVLIVTDTETTKVARAIYEASSEATARVLLMMMPELDEKGMEPPTPVADLMRRQDVIFLLTTKSMTHTRARANASKEGARIASIPGVSQESFAIGGFTADHNAMATEISSLSSKLRRVREVRDIHGPRYGSSIPTRESVDSGGHGNMHTSRPSDKPTRWESFRDA